MRLNHKKDIFAVAALFILWELASRIADRNFLPGAAASICALFRLLKDGTLCTHFAVSLYRIGLGTLIGLLAAVPTGILLGQSKKWNDSLGTVLNILYPVPKVVFLPIIVVCMGIGDAPKIFLIALVLFFQMVIVIRDASMNIPEIYARSMMSIGANRCQYLYHLVFQACLPDIMTALRSTVGVSTAMLFITENFASSKGLGYYITKCMSAREYENMYAAILALIALGLLLYGTIDLLEKKTCKWKILERGIQEE